MAQIGTFTRGEDGVFNGTIRTLSLNVKARLIPADSSSNAKAPALRTRRLLRARLVVLIRPRQRLRRCAPSTAPRPSLLGSMWSAANSSQPGRDIAALQRRKE
jgi:hypothetical protein